MRLKKIVKTILFSLVLDVTAAFAAPEGGEVVEGTARIEGENSRNITVNQSSNKAIINWRTFNEAPDESVTFHTPGADSVTLNRVTGGSASDIEGHLSSNGQVWIINPNGVMFGSSAEVNVAGLMASTLDISDENFEKGNYAFNQTQANAAKVINEGHINADNGYVALLAPEVANAGVVSAKLGTVALAAGTEATVTFSGNQLLNIAIPENAGVKTQDGNAPITQSGLLQADGGQVLLTAESVNTLLDESINMTGVIKADTVQNANGKIILTSSHNIMVDKGTLSAQGKADSETGGEVDVIGAKIALRDNTVIDASGDTGGGIIRVGRYEDQKHQVTEADYTTIDPTVSLQANATRRGNGGFIETSGNILDEESSHISTLGARDGKAGTWLLDPFNLTISTDPDNDVSPSTPFEPNDSSSNLNTSTLVTALATGNVEVQTGAGAGSEAGDINVNSAINSTSAYTLTLNAYGNININQSIELDGALTATAQHGAITDNSSGASVKATTTNLTAGSSVDDTGSYVRLMTGNNDLGTVNVTAYGAAAGSSVTLINAGDLDIGTITAPEAVYIRAQNVTQNSEITTTSGGAVTIVAGGDFSQSTAGRIVTGSDTTWGDITIHAGVDEEVGTGALTSSGIIEGNVLIIDSSMYSTGDVTQSGAWLSHDTGGDFISGITVKNYGTGNIVQTSTGEMILTFPNVPTTDLGLALTALQGSITQSGTLDAKQSRVTLDAQGNGGHITQDNGAGYLGNITAGETIINAGTNDISLNGTNRFAGTITLAGKNISLSNIATTPTILSNIAATGNFEGSFFSNIIQESDTAITVGGTTAINGESNDVTLNNSGNSFTGAVNITGNTIDLKANADLTLDTIHAAGNLTVNTPGSVTLNSIEAGSKVILSASNLINEGGASAITASDGWNIYLASLSGNNFDYLASGNQAIWGRNYETPITESGNRYIFDTPQTLTLTPESTPFTVSKAQYASANLPTPQVGTTLQANGFVNASAYGDVFTQDTANNVSLSGLEFTSSGTTPSAAVGEYPINLSGIGTTSTGYGVSYDNQAVFGELAVTPESADAEIVTPTIVNPEVAGALVQENSANDFMTLLNFSGNNPMLQDLTQNNCETSGGMMSCTIVIPAGVSAEQMPFTQLLTAQQKQKLEQTQSQFERHVNIVVNTKTGAVTNLTVTPKDVVVEE